MKKVKSELKTGIILNYINVFAGMLIPVFYTPVMIRLLGQEEYGLYKLAGGVTSYLSLISLGIGSAVSRYLIKARTEEGKEAEEKTLGLFVIIFQIIAVLCFIAGTVLALNLAVWYGGSLTEKELQRMGVLVFLLSCNTALSFSQSPYITVVSAHEKFIFMQIMNTISTCVAPILNLLLLFCGFRSVGMAVLSIALGIICRIAYIIYVHKHIGIHARYKQMPTQLLKEIIVFSFWVFVASVVGQLYNATDTVMIGTIAVLGTTGVAVYNVGGVFNHIVLSLTTGISNLLTPRTQKMVFSGASSKELTDMAIRVGRLQCYIITLVVTGFIAFGQPFIHFYAGEDYSDAYWVAVLMMIPNMIPLVQTVFLSIIVARNKHRFRSLVYLVIAVLNVIGTWFLMHTPLGIIGAALMTGIALIIGQGIIMNWYYWKRMGLEIGRFWTELGTIYVIPIIMCIVTLIISHYVSFFNIVTLLTGIILYTGVYCILNWRFVMNNYEKNLVLVPLHKITSKIKKL